MKEWETINERYVRPALEREKRGDRPAAMSLLREGRNAAPDDGYIALILGEMYLREGRREEAVPELECAFSKLPKETFKQRAMRSLEQARGQSWPKTREMPGRADAASRGRRIGLVGCAKDKLDKPSKAEELYAKSTRFCEALRNAKTECDIVYIVSGRFGLLGLDDFVSPYDFHLSRLEAECRHQWAGFIVGLLAAVEESAGIAEVRLYAVPAYAEPLENALKHRGLPCAVPGWPR